MSWSSPGSGDALPPPPTPTATTPTATMPPPVVPSPSGVPAPGVVSAPSAHWGAPPPAASGPSLRGVLVLVLTGLAVLALLVRTFADVQGVPRLAVPGVGFARGPGRSVVLMLLMAAAAVAGVVRDELAGLAGGLTVVAGSAFSNWLFQGATTGRIRAVTYLGLVTVGVATLTWVVGALWPGRTRPPRLSVGVAAAGFATTGLLFLGQFLPVHRFAPSGEQLTMMALLAGFAVASRAGLWSAIGVAVGRVLVPVYYLVVSPRRNPFDVFLHPLAFVAYVLVIIVAVVGLAQSPTAAPAA